jgi:hypothetical protein
MNLGKMQCLGSSQFLKMSLGAGYRLIFDKKEEMTNEQLAFLTEYVKRHIEESSYAYQAGHDNIAVYTLPFNTVHKFGSFFEDLEKDQNKLNVTGAVSSIFDVFSC